MRACTAAEEPYAHVAGRPMQMGTPVTRSPAFPLLAFRAVIPEAKAVLAAREKATERFQAQHVYGYDELEYSGRPHGRPPCWSDTAAQGCMDFAGLVARRVDRVRSQKKFLPS